MGFAVRHIDSKAHKTIQDTELQEIVKIKYCFLSLFKAPVIYFQ